MLDVVLIVVCIWFSHYSYRYLCYYTTLNKKYSILLLYCECESKRGGVLLVFFSFEQLLLVFVLAKLLGEHLFWSVAKVCVELELFCNPGF